MGKIRNRGIDHKLVRDMEARRPTNHGTFGWNPLLARLPRAVVTDSGTFQSYIYGDVEVGPEEIVAFQSDMGVDIGTMLDVFGRPDMTRQQLESAVEETADRATPSLSVAGSELLLNGPIQGGTHADLRAESSLLMGSAESLSLIHI